MLKLDWRSRINAEELNNDLIVTNKLKKINIIY